MTHLENRSARLRQIENLLLLNPQGLSVIDLAQHFDIDRRTVYRDLDFLSTQGVPVWQGEGRFGIQPTRYLATVRLTFHEAIAWQAEQPKTVPDEVLAHIIAKKIVARKGAERMTSDGKAKKGAARWLISQRTWNGSDWLGSDWLGSDWPGSDNP